MASRIAWLLLAVLLAVPPISATRTVVATACFLAEFLSDGQWRPLSLITPSPASRPLAAVVSEKPAAIDVYTRRSLGRPSGLVLVHGLSPTGKDEPRLRQAAALLARAGWAVAVPTVDGLTRLRLRPDDARVVVAAAQALRDERYVPVAVLGISLGAGPGLLAAGDPEIASTVSAVLALGGYASAVELLRYTLTGAYRFEAIRGRQTPDEAAIAQFARANAELVDAAGRRLVANRDPDALDALVADLPASTRQLLTALSPAESLDRMSAPLFLVHGRTDPAVPFTETLRIERRARAAGLPVRAAIVGGVGHVEAGEPGALADVWRLWTTFHAFRVTSAGPSP